MTRPTARIALSAVALVLGPWAVSGCTDGGGEDGAGTTLDALGDEEALALSEDDLRERADQTQLDILDAPGEISFAEYQSAIGRAVSCMREAGIEVVGDTDVDRSRGFPVIPFSFSGTSNGRSDDETLALADDCQYKFSFLVAGAYEVQPSSIEAQEVEFEKKRPAILACLADAGRELPDDAAMTEIQDASFDLLTSEGIDCEGG